jgi:sulfonate transport system substrate-binding protein
MSRFTFHSRVHRRAAAGLVTVALAASVTACGGSSSPAKAATPAKATSDAVSLAGVTLKIGDQVHFTESLMQAAGQLNNLPYKIEWSQFSAGAPLLASLETGAIDAGLSGDASVATAFVNGGNIRGIAVSEDANTNAEGIVVAKNSPIKTLADLKGKTISPTTPGSIGQYFLVEALAKAGISPSQVKVAPLAPSDAIAALKSGDIQAWATWDPYLALEKASGFRELTSATGIVSEQEYLNANAKAVASPTVGRALADFRTRYENALLWENTHRSAYASLYSKLTGLPAAVASEVTADGAGTRFLPLASTEAHLQAIVNLFYKLHELPKDPSVAPFLSARLP